MPFGNAINPKCSRVARQRSRLKAQFGTPYFQRVKKLPRLALLNLGIAFLSSCGTLDPNSVATTHLTYSKTVNRTPAESPIHIYFEHYWKAVSKAELDDDLRYKQTLSTSGLLEERIGFQIGTIEIDYSISKAGALKIEPVRAPKHLKKQQISLARNAMQKASLSLKGPPPDVSSLDEETIRDTMVFDYR